MNKKQIKQFDDFLKTQLNSAQKKAVIHENGPLLVVAGAGSGKTRVITARITNLILKKNINPSEIVALTFTNKAAQEMLERIAHFLGSDYELPFIGTSLSGLQTALISVRHLPVPFWKSQSSY